MTVRSVPVRDVLLGCGMAFLVVFALLVPLPFHSSLAGALGDLVHAPMFAAVTLVGLRALDRWMPVPFFGRQDLVRSGLVVAAAFGFGVGMELVQSYAGRSAALHDAIANGLGTLAGLSWFVGRHRIRIATSHEQARRPHRPWLKWQLASLVLIAITWWEPMHLITDFFKGRFSFPMLASFESGRELNRWHYDHCSARLTTQNVTDGKTAMELTFFAVPHPAATLLQVWSDWTKMRYLEIDVVLDEGHRGDGVNFVLKVIDRDHANYHDDTFRRTTRLKPGQPVHLRIPLDEVAKGPKSRDLDLSRIKFVSVLVLESPEPTTLHIDGLKLSP